MGFLDKLFGRGKDAAQSTADATKDAGSKAQETVDDATSRVTGEDDLSDVGQSEQRLDNVRDQALRDEGRMP